MRLADEGTLYNVNAIVSKCIVLGENPKLCRRSEDTGSYLFCSPYSPLNHLDIISKSAIPPAMQGDDLTIFEYKDYYTSQYSTLYVPEGSIEAYKADPEWGKFERIVPIGTDVDITQTPEPNTIELPLDPQNPENGFHIYTINSDKNSVTLTGIKAAKDVDTNIPAPSLDALIPDDDGNLYPVTGIGNGIDRLPYSSYNITPNIVRLNNFACSNKVTIDAACRFEYIGYQALKTKSINTLRIADGGDSYRRLGNRTHAS